MDMKISNDGCTLVYDVEGCEYKWYPDSKGYPTIGIGHLILPNEQWMKNITLTDNQVKDIFLKDIATRESWLNTHCSNWEIPIKQYEFDALCSFLFQYDIENVNYSNTKHAIISGDRQQIIKHLMMFINVDPASHDGRLLPRRLKEIAMFKGNST